ncbi:MAG: hypothetical protein F4Y22_08955 [Gammaproteobacteria bacterium]|nr:hypothetical protein [Gammaproteobacteria bacterium]MYH46502.1 hypothetical protein [Gammaproteobacteria bacterium]MYL14960.1 hypothetical protein [Gammaproteobacteria bacterium]
METNSRRNNVRFVESRLYWRAKMKKPPLRAVFSPQASLNQLHKGAVEADYNKVSYIWQQF